MIKQCLILFFVLSFSFSARAEQTIRLTTGEWTPYISEKLEHFGLVSRIITEAFALEGVKVEYIFLPWKRAYKEALIGTYDGSVVWTRNSEREKGFYYSDVVIEGQSVFFHMKSYPFDWESSDDLVGVKVGGTLGYKYALLEDLEKKGKIIINRVATDDQNFRMLLLKRIHIFQQDREAGYDWLQEHFKPEEVQRITHHSKPVVNDAYHLIMPKKNKNNAHILYLFNNGLRRLKENGKYNQYISESRRGEYKKEAHAPSM